MGTPTLFTQSSAASLVDTWSVGRGGGDLLVDVRLFVPGTLLFKSAHDGFGYVRPRCPVGMAVHIFAYPCNGRGCTSVGTVESTLLFCHLSCPPCPPSAATPMQ